MPQATGAVHPSYDLTRLGVAGLSAHRSDEAATASRTTGQYEFIVVDKGLLLCELDTERFVAPPGALVLVRPDMRTAILSRSERRTELRSLRFTLTLPDGVLPDPAAWPSARILTRDPLAQALVAHVFELLAVGSPVHHALAKNGLRHLLAVFLAAGQQSLDPLGLPPPVEKALTYTKKLWERNALRSPTLEQLAAAAGVSTGHLTRLFRGSLGVAPLRALRRLRLERAATELVTSRRTIKEIAYDAGFGSQFHFSRCFKKSFGRTPSAFRGDSEERRLTA